MDNILTICSWSFRADFNFSERTQLFVYGGPLSHIGAAGIPASRVGIRESAEVGHHQQDSTHISNNVITLGFASGPVAGGVNVSALNRTRNR
jgi:hypothetical protein